MQERAAGLGTQNRKHYKKNMKKIFLLLIALSSCAKIEYVPAEAAARNAILSLPTPDFWLDGTVPYTSGIAGDNNNRWRPQFISSDPNAYPSTLIVPGGLRVTPKYNGEGVFNNGARGCSFGTASDWTAYSNGSAWTAYYLFKQIPQSTSVTPKLLWRTQGISFTTASQIGFGIHYLHTATANTFRIDLWNGSGPQYQIVGTTNAIQDDAYNILKVTFTGSSLTAWVKQFGGSFVQIGQDNVGGVLSGSNPTSTLTWGAAVNSQVAYLKHYMMFKRLLTPTEETDIESFLDDESDNVIVPDSASTYFYSGQSQNGTGLNPPAIDLQIRTDAKHYFLHYPNENQATYQTGMWGNLEYGVNHNNLNMATTHGYQLRFGKEISDLTDTYIIGRWVGSTALIPQPSGGSWSALSPINTVDLYPYWMNGAGFGGQGGQSTGAVVLDALKEMIHVERKIPVIRGDIWCQGEADAGKSATTRADYLRELKGRHSTTTSILWAAGYDTSKMHTVIIKIVDGILPSGSLVQAADDDFVNSYPANRHMVTTTGLPLLGGHLTAVGQDSVGWRVFRAFKPFVNE